MKVGFNCILIRGEMCMKANISIVLGISLILLGIICCSTNSSPSECSKEIQCYGTIAQNQSPLPPPTPEWVVYMNSALSILRETFQIFGPVLAWLLLDYLREKLQKRKDGNSKTPSTVCARQFIRVSSH